MNADSVTGLYDPLRVLTVGVSPVRAARGLPLEEHASQLPARGGFEPCVWSLRQATSHDGSAYTGLTCVGPDELRRSDHQVRPRDSCSASVSLNPDLEGRRCVFGRQLAEPANLVLNGPYAASRRLSRMRSNLDLRRTPGAPGVPPPGEQVLVLEVSLQVREAPLLVERSNQATARTIAPDRSARLSHVK